MHCSKHDTSKFYNLIRKMRGQNSSQNLQMLHTPAGTFYGKDTLEGFARDAEILAEKVSDSNRFDKKFCNMCA